MATVLISFLGKGQKPDPRFGTADAPTSPGGYTKTRYAFDGTANISKETSLFGAALRNYLGQTGQTPARWLIMGTAASAWTELLEAMPATAHDALIEPYFRLDAAVKSEAVDSILLAEWEKELCAVPNSPLLHCRLVGEMAQVDSQYLAWNALHEVLAEGDRVIMDITNSLRNQPVISAFMLMALRWLKNLADIQLYYGAFDLKPKNETVCPVMRLDIVPVLVQASEALSAFRHTGSILPLTSFLSLEAEYARQANQVALAEETNQVTPRVQQNALQLRNSLKRMTLPCPVETTLLPVLRENLEWVGDENLGQQLLRKAKTAHRTQQYASAFASLWEAFRVTGCLLYQTGEPLYHKAREEGERRWLDELKRSDREAFNLLYHAVRVARNSMVHGSPADHTDIQNTLYSREALDDLFEQGYAVIARFLQQYARSLSNASRP